MTVTESPAVRPERRTPEQWAELVQNYEGGGQSQRAFCAERGIGQSSLRYWKRRLEQGCGSGHASIPRSTRLVPVKVVGDAPALTNSAPDSGVVVVSRGGLRVEIAREFDAPALARVLAILEAP